MVTVDRGEEDLALFTGSDDSRVGLLATPFPWITMLMLGLGKAGR